MKNSKYRILKQETKVGSKVDTRYYIQKKILFWWFRAGITCQYYTHINWNARNAPSHIALLIKRYYIFNSEESARKVLDKISNPFRCEYKGERIKRVFEDHTLSDIYINLSYGRWWSNNFGYEFHHDLNLLIAEIDKRNPEIIQTVI